MSNIKPVHYEDINDRPGAPSLCGNTDRNSMVCADPEQVTCDKCLERFNAKAHETIKKETEK